ncbi:PhzF family phenazine biosynthesis protein [Brevundimonas sp.]
MRQWTVDAFAERPFMGNPAAVLQPLENWPDAGWMQALAAENNHSETAFLKTTRDDARFELRWFTPAMEVSLCGHATLAAAHVLWRELGLETRRLTFDTASGVLTVDRFGEVYELNFPADPLTRVETPRGLAKALGAEPLEVWASRYLIAVMADAKTVRELKPDIPALLAFGEGAMESGQVIAAAISAEGADVVDRFFGPGCGVDEDPATGSARCGLAPLFATKLGRTNVTFEQAYPGRGARFETELHGDRVLIRGNAVTVMSSVLRF